MELSDNLLKKFDKEAKDIDIILDLESPGFPSIEGFSKAIVNCLKNFPSYTSWKTFTIIGTSIPKSMADVKKGIANLEFLIPYVLTSSSVSLSIAV